MNINKVFIFSLTTLLILSFRSGLMNAQSPKKWTSGEIYMHLEKLNFLGSVLYVAAHPDDENTRLISYIANEQKANTTYLSLTRGDGGQNLIGTEINELLGVMRTQELLMARSLDNGKQMFSRANDFGYSKNAEETIAIWDTEKINADVVWAIRKCRPDVIINRFDHRTSGNTHGHHTASAILALDMFDKSNDPSVFPSHLKYVKPWQAQRIFFNTSWWFYGSQDKFEKADKSALMGVDVGVYFPLLGKSNTEIAAESRSKHKCQGFGSTGTRGSQMEYLELLKGDMPTKKQDIFEGINTTWSRVKGGEDISPLVENAISSFDFKNPESILPQLTEIYKAIQQIDDEHWKSIKSEECLNLIYACAGLFAEAKSNTHTATRNEEITIDFEVVKRLNSSVSLSRISSTFFNLDTLISADLADNEIFKLSRNVIIPKDAAYTAPYWLTNKGDLGTYHVENEAWIGMPETPKQAIFTFHFLINGVEISIPKDVIYKFNSPENGETYRPFEIVTPVSVSIIDPVYIFNDNTFKNVKVLVKSYSKNQTGSVSIPLPKNWKSEPKEISFNLVEKGESKELVFKIFPPQNQEEINIFPIATLPDQVINNELVEVNYDHIPFQIVYKQAEAKLSRLDIKITPIKIAYLKGAGDQIPSNLQQIGYQVDIITPEDLNLLKLSQYQSLIFGVRAFNTEQALKFKQKEVLEYVKSGGNVVIQYNTANGLVTKDLGPYPFTVSRDRVTVEDAEMRFLAKDHPILNSPNKITSQDFEGWVQERGLYFTKDWDSRYTPIFSSNDPGEAPTDGSLLVTQYGKGYYIYTGLSFFRQLPAGVSGAYRLFANLVSLGNVETP